MPSKNTAIAVRLPEPMYRQIVERAAAEHRSLSNFVEHHLRRLLGPDNETVFRDIERTDPRADRQVDLAEEIARAVKRGPSKSAKHK
jgi:hypothetical protein